MLVNVYAVMEGDKVVAKGTDYELRALFNTPSRMSSYEVNGTRFQGKYRVVKSGTVEQNISYARKPVQKSKEDKTMPYLIEHLQRYGNTVFAKKNPEHYIELLKKEGINCKTRKVADFDGKKTTYYYIFEVA